MRRLRLYALALSLTACNDEEPVGDDGSAAETESESESGDGDGDNGEGNDENNSGEEGGSADGGEAAGDGDGDGDPVCGPQPGDDECTMCLKESCCEEFEACLDDPDCVCVTACLDEGMNQLQCLTNCGLLEPNLIFGALEGCTMLECGQECA